ncbi:MAG: hypothetical protein A4E60_00337 [Syntrophorhabdus sp. PtaB.Bin047]|nr:MAG: hypothetical protein A4E60_00337 [Syntrophorhabdus sp. PtaB.Bin047]
MFFISMGTPRLRATISAVEDPQTILAPFMSANSLTTRASSIFRAGGPVRMLRTCASRQSRRLHVVSSPYVAPEMSLTLATILPGMSFIRVPCASRPLMKSHAPWMPQPIRYCWPRPAWLTPSLTMTMPSPYSSIQLTSPTISRPMGKTRCFGRYAARRLLMRMGEGIS